MNIILLSVIIVGAIGLIAGVGLSLASTVMAVEKNPLAKALEEALPGANCGACGYSGCAGYAQAMSDGTAALGLCSPGGEITVSDCAHILGSDEVAVEYKTALVRCMGSYDNTDNKMKYDGIMSCSACTFLAGGISSCRFGCMGLMDCERACAYGAVSICNGVAKIDPAKCVGCSKCVTACPKGLIKFVPLRTQAVVRCSSCEKAAATVKVCKVGCIGCNKCVKICSHNAVEVIDGCAFVNAEKCVGCGDCVDACPRHIITMLKV